MNKCKTCVHKLVCRYLHTASNRDNCPFYILKDKTIVHFELYFDHFEAKCAAPADLTLPELLTYKKRIKSRVPVLTRKYTSFATDLWFTHEGVFIMNTEAAEYLKICEFSAEV